MKCEFSEKIFEIFWDHEFLNMPGMGIYIPSQNKEKKLGYDALLQIKKIKPIAIQFKVPESLKNNPFGHSSLSAYKFELHKDKFGHFVQHQTLLRKNRIMPTFYVAPLYNDFKNLYDSHNKSLVIRNSICIDPIPLTPTKNHHVKYDSFPSARFYSRDGFEANAFLLSKEILNNIFKQVEAMSSNYFIGYVENENEFTDEHISKDFYERKTVYLYKIDE